MKKKFCTGPLCEALMPFLENVTHKMIWTDDLLETMLESKGYIFVNVLAKIVVQELNQSKIWCQEREKLEKLNQGNKV